MAEGSAADGSAHDATLYFRERAGRDSDEFYANAEIGEFWIGPRPSLRQVAADLGSPPRPSPTWTPPSPRRVPCA
ncbi:hypothetical protein BC477_18800 [Clavibacter michiganensis subsp. michiganensis]|uniref:Uncharacterized protein n=1 Tax=Clavibacter michiganensis subsp. michiganensis TaxID=33013 RepID=A0A251XH77_CLAMM|nr:hypothetical protein BC477_18800 [Clavibacter michiganensis subsp. michiganensis]OUE01533.1 hypothetical protein CMMCAS07_14585 [Clavibacter michiganensis subsp. michiganensis]